MQAKLLLPQSSSKITHPQPKTSLFSPEPRLSQTMRPIECKTREGYTVQIIRQENRLLGNVKDAFDNPVPQA